MWYISKILISCDNDQIKKFILVVLAIGFAIATVIGLTIDLESGAIGNFIVFEMKYIWI